MIAVGLAFAAFASAAFLVGYLVGRKHGERSALEGFRLSTITVGGRELTVWVHEEAFR